MAITPSNLLVNIGTLRGQQALHQTESALTKSIRNLTSGLRIHSAKDDPTGYTTAASMSAELAGLSQAAANCQKNSSVIAVIDSALSHVNALLNDIRGLVTEAASTGTETPETLTALQIQADAILETINRISDTTTFQNIKLLDGSLDFKTYGLDSSKVSLLNLNQANFQGRTEKDIVVQVYQPARQAELYFPYGGLVDNTHITVGGSEGYQAFSFDRDATVHDIAHAVNLFSDSTGIGASVFAKSTTGSIALTSYGKDNDVIVTASEPGTAAANFVFRYTAPKEGNSELSVNVSEGSGNDPTVVEIMLQTEPGGNVLTDANQVVTLLNTAPALKNPDGTGRITASLPPNAHGFGKITPFSEVGYYGDSSTNNYLQFLAPAGSPSIKFVSTAGTPLSVDDTTYPPVYAKASAVIQGFEQGTSFTLQSLIPGKELDGVKVIFQDEPTEGVRFDENSKTLTFSADFTGRLNDPAKGDLSIEDLRLMVANDPALGGKFAVYPQTLYSPESPPMLDSANYAGINALMGQTSGGVVSNGTLLVHLETDERGVIKTTANDLVKFFNDPSTEESRAVLDRLGISVSIIDPTNAQQTVCVTGKAEIGKGLLGQTYTPPNSCPPEGMLPDVIFGSYGSDVREEYPTATVSSNGGRNADWTLTAKNAGAAYNNVAIRFTTDAAEASVKYDPARKELLVSIDPRNPSSANDIVSLINGTPEVSALFAASLPDYSNGEGLVTSNDRGTLTGGIAALDARAECLVLSAAGVHSAFTIQTKQASPQYSNTEVLVIDDAAGPKVTYDSQAKQLTISINPASPITAQQAVDLINATPDIRDIFEAKIPAFLDGTSIVPNGLGFVLPGSSGMMTVSAAGAQMGAAMLGASDNNALGLVFYSLEYGSGEFVDVRSTAGGEFPVMDKFGNIVEQAVGTDILADINGRRAIGKGREAMSATSELDISIMTTAEIAAGDVFGFRISGGGTLMQLGPNAVWSQQLRISIPSIHTTALGGESGTLSQLKTDEPFSLLKDTNRAFRIVEETITQITTLRGRLGSLQRNQLDANRDNLMDAINIETEARSTIADVDFAAESSEFARQQLLMQSTITVLQQSGQMKQLLLSLLQG